MLTLGGGLFKNEVAKIVIHLTLICVRKRVKCESIGLISTSSFPIKLKTSVFGDGISLRTSRIPYWILRNSG